MDDAAILTDEEVRTVLEDLKERLKSVLGSDLVSMRLFGSRARGDADPDSDVDVAIIVRRCDSAMRELILDVVSSVELEHVVPLSTLIFAEDTFDRLLERERRIALDIEQEGVAV